MKKVISNKNKIQSKILVNAVVEADPRGGFSAFVPSMPGVNTEAETMSELETNLQEAIAGWQKAYQDNEPKFTLMNRLEYSMPTYILPVNVSVYA